LKENIIIATGKGSRRYIKYHKIYFVVYIFLIQLVFSQRIRMLHQFAKYKNLWKDRSKNTKTFENK